MTNHDQPETLPPINQPLTLDIYDAISNATAKLRDTLLRAADFAEHIGIPQNAQSTGLTQNVIQLIWAINDATQKITAAHRKRQRSTTAKRDDSQTKNHNAAHRTKPSNLTNPPSTDNLERLDRELEHQRIDPTTTE